MLPLEIQKINVLRVSERAKNGGHSIEPNTIITRYGRSLQLLPEAVLSSDNAHIVDTTNFECIKHIELGKDLTPSEKMQKLQTFLEEGDFPTLAIEATKEMNIRQQEHETLMSFHDWTSSELIPNIRELIKYIPSPIKEEIQKQLMQKDLEQGKAKKGHDQNK